MPKPKSIPKWQQTLVQWSPLVGTSGLTFFLASSQKFGAAIASAFLTGATLLWGSYSKSFMAEAEQEAEKLGEKSAQWFFQLIYRLGNAVKEWAIQLWWAVSLNFTGKYYKRLDILCREFETNGITLDQVLSLQNIFVAVHLSPRNLVQVSPNLLQNRDGEDLAQDLKDKEIGNYLALMPKNPEFRRLAILGAPGSGKTTLMRYLALMYASRKPRRLHPLAPQYLPVLLYLRNIYEEILTKPEITLAELLTQWVQNLQRVDPFKLPKNWFTQQLREGKCLVLLDGLDEVANMTHRQAVSQWVDQQMSEYPETPFILTSRRLGYEEAQLKQAVQVLEVEPLSAEQIEQFVNNWYREVERTRRMGQDDLATKEAASSNAQNLLNQINRDKALQDLASNPLLLTLIARVHQQNERIPLKRVELYQSICEVMLGKRQEAKGIRSPLTIREKLSVLQPLALELMRRQTRQFQLEEVETLFGEHLAKLPNPPQPLEFLKQLQAVDALIAKEREGDYEFAHLSFQEYLAAVEVKETKQEQIFLEALHDPKKLSWWAETMRLYAAQTDASELVNAILQEPNLEKLLLAWDFCQQGFVNPEPKKALLEVSNKPLEILDEIDRDYAISKQPFYFKLAYYLQTGQWKEADRETLEVMRRVIDKISIEGIKNFPCADLRVIDRLWVKYSNGKFGFSVQKQIWLDVNGKLDYGDDEDAAQQAFLKFSSQVEWQKDGKFIPDTDLVWEVAIAPLAHHPNPFFLTGAPPTYLYSRIQTCRL
jgi:energy-coupling factor transporter ATP-binding protein EcfA2